MHTIDRDVFKRIIHRERRARHQAETVLEEKSRALYFANEELKLTAAALEEEAKKSSTVLETAAEAIIAFGEDGIIESANPAAREIFGLQAKDFIGADIRDLVDADSVAPDFEKNGFCTNRLDKPQICLGKRGDGSTFEMELSGSRVQLDDRLLFTWLLRDVTKQRELERQLALAQKMESVGQLAAGIAHEINTPMQFVGDNLTFLKTAFESLLTLVSRCEQLANDKADAEVMRQEMAEIKNKIKFKFLESEIPLALEQSKIGATRVSEIVAAMKEFSHPGTQKKSCIDLNKAIASTIQISRNEWKYVADVETDLAASLPEVSCYPGELNQALLNLIVNAAHAIADTNSSRGTIRIRSYRDTDHVVVELADTGNGIPKEIRNKIFEPFFTTKPVGKGTGQGLAIVYSVIVEKHGGTIDINSHPGEGTTFTLRLPLHTTDEKDSYD